MISRQASRPSEYESDKNSLPTGEITLLFTDIAGSSQMWERYGDAFIPVWQAHDAVLQDAFTRFGGCVVKGEGDSFMVAFKKPDDALHCALFAQAALCRYPWPTDIAAPRVRIGMHTGEPFLHGNDYFGPCVNRAAHICAAAHGGQVLLSHETRCALSDQIDDKIEMQDLGELRLKDMGHPQRLYQACHPSVDRTLFPPPRSLDGQPHNLPQQKTSFVGRAREIEQIAGFLAQGEKPVLTLTGPGGIGKTRLSLQAAAAKAEWFPDGVWFVRLVEARDVIGAAVEIAAAMNLPLRSGESPLAQAREFLADRRCLLILDDANALPQADRLIRELVSGSNGLRCLATSRESLQIAEADDLPLGGLSLTEEAPMTATIDERKIMQDAAPPAQAAPDADAAPSKPETRSDAWRLFLERAAEANSAQKITPREAQAVDKLLRELDGIPASVERAARITDRTPPSAILEWLRQRFAQATTPAQEASGAEKLRGLLRRNAQKVCQTVEETTRASIPNLGQLLQGIADVATDRKEEKQAAELGRQSLQISREAGDSLGTAAALRQLARLRWRQGNPQIAVMLLAASVEIYRGLEAPETREAERELETLRERLQHSEESPFDTPSVENAVALALGE